jgi:hypothetical protein
MAGRFEDERWANLPLDLDFDAEEPEEPELLLPPGWHIVILPSGLVRLAQDLPDIAEYKRTG